MRYFLGAVRRRKNLVIVAVAVALGVSLATSFTQERLYRATARILLQPDGTGSLFGSSVAGAAIDPERALQTELDLIKNLQVPAAVERVGHEIVRVSAEAAENTDIIEVSSLAKDPQLAARSANAYARTYIRVRRNRSVNNLQAVARQLEAKILALDRQIAGTPPPAAPAPDQPAGNQEAKLLGARQSAMHERLDEVKVEEALTTGGAQLAAPASAPTQPMQPQPVRNGGIAASLGLMLGLGMAFILEQFDDRISSREELQGVVGQLPVLAVIPVVPSFRRRNPQIVMLEDSDHKATEAYRSLRTSLQYLGLGQNIGILEVTSTGVGEGKTTVVANLAVALGQAGMEVIVVSCDLRRPFVHRLFGLNNDFGFSSVVKHEMSLTDALQRVPGNLPISVLPSGPVPPNPSELLSSASAERTFAELRRMGAIVLVDSPPLLSVADASVIVHHADATLLVASAEMTRRRHLLRGTEVLRQIDASVIGVTLNRVGNKDGGGRYKYDEPSEGRSARSEVAR